jgi:hypothetical protein
MALYFSDDVKKKLAEKHNVSEKDVLQCFQNLGGECEYIRDTREDNQTVPPTYWFISETNRLRVLKVAFIAKKIETEKGPELRIEIKTAYEPNAEEIAIYNKHGKQGN